MVTITVLSPSSRLKACLCGCAHLLLCFSCCTLQQAMFFVLLTFGQPTFKVLFNLSKGCRGTEQHLNNIVSANVLPCVLREACRQSTIYSLPHQKSRIYI